MIDVPKASNTVDFFSNALVDKSMVNTISILHNTSELTCYRVHAACVQQ